MNNLSCIEGCYGNLWKQQQHDLQETEKGFLPRLKTKHPIEWQRVKRARVTTTRATCKTDCKGVRTDMMSRHSIEVVKEDGTRGVSAKTDTRDYLLARMSMSRWGR